MNDTTSTAQAPKVSAKEVLMLQDVRAGIDATGGTAVSMKNRLVKKGLLVKGEKGYALTGDGGKLLHSLPGAEVNTGAVVIDGTVVATTYRSDLTETDTGAAQVTDLQGRIAAKVAARAEEEAEALPLDEATEKALDRAGDEPVFGPDGWQACKMIRKGEWALTGGQHIMRRVGDTKKWHVITITRKDGARVGTRLPLLFGSYYKALEHVGGKAPAEATA